MKGLLVCLTAIVLLSVSTAYAQPEPANYAEVINRFKLFYNNNKPDSIYQIFGPEMRKSVSAEQFGTTMGQLKTQLGVLNQTIFASFNTPVAAYNAVFQKGRLEIKLSLNKTNQIVGLLLQPVQEAKATTTAPEAVNDPFFTETPASYKTLAGDIASTITMPKNAAAKVPLVLIIPDSGPTDRNGNNPMGINSNSYQLLARGLAQSGIASLRYDKRNTGQPVTPAKEKEKRFEDNSDDAIALINLLHGDARFSKLIVLGHGEGSLAGMLAAYEQPVSAFISVEGAGSRADELLTAQMKSQPEHIANGFKVILDSLKKGKLTERVDPALYPVARPSIQPYISSWMMHDPAKEIRKLKIPVLIIQGTTDLQVNVTEAEKLKKAKSDAVLAIIPNMNHVLKEAPVDRDTNLATYHNPDLPIKPELLTAITTFINKLK